jgi:hypothetical protein
MHVGSIAPHTDATFTVKFQQSGTTYDNATLTRQVWNPRGTLLTANPVTVASTGSGGLYRMDVPKAWSEVNGKALEGEYIIRVTRVRSGVQSVRTFRYTVRFDDDE